MIIYTTDHRVGYNEIGKDHKLTIPAMIDNFSNCGVFHGEDKGVSLNYLEERHLSWLVCGYQAIIYEMPELGERITVNTAAYDFKICMGGRNFMIRNSSGRIVIKADSQWVLMNMEDGTPFRVSDYMCNAYGVAKELKLQDDFRGRKIKRAEAAETFEPITVTPPMLDTNRHVNNGQYVHIAQSYLPDDLRYTYFRCEYKKQARLGDKMIPVLAQNDQYLQSMLLDENGETIFIGEWEWF